MNRLFFTKPIAVEAIQWDGSEAIANEIGTWANGEGFDWDQDDIKVAWYNHSDINELVCCNDDGEDWAPAGYWVVKQSETEFRPIHPDKFAATFQPAVPA